VNWKLVAKLNQTGEVFSWLMEEDNIYKNNKKDAPICQLKVMFKPSQN